ncbi:hypothetical protein CP8484711_1758A, partial [Chlamydia psittaci 84-8471/1]
MENDATFGKDFF